MSVAETADRLVFDPPGPGVWQRDEDHWPRPVPRSYTELYTDATIPYVREWTGRYGLLLDYFEVRFPHGFGYGRMRPVGEPKKGAAGPPPKPVFQLLLKVHPQLRARRRAAEQALAERLWLTDAAVWERDARPAVVAENRANAAVRRDELSDEQLLDHIDRCRETLRRFIGLHHRYNGGMVPVGLLMVAMGDWTGDQHAVLSLLEGSSPVSSGRSAELDRLAGAIRADARAQAVIDSGEPAGEKLARLDAGSDEVVAAYRDYLEVVGFRLVGDSIEHGNPTLVEQPELMLHAIRAAVDGDSPGPDEAALAARTAQIRAQVPARHHQEFDQLLDDVRRTYRMRDERSVYADVWAAGIFRQALLELGRRLARRGRLAEPVHLIEASAAEVAALASDDGRPDADELATRAQLRATRATLPTPALLGGEPSPPPPLEWLPPALARMNAAIFVQIEGFLGHGQAQEDGDVLRGAAASAGVYEGTARVVTGPEDFGRIQPGNVLVARTTSEAFNVVLPLLGAIVTDRGGVLSHAAIVAREAGIPCVVGTGEATRRIADDAHVLVDGSAGEVKIG